MDLEGLGLRNPGTLSINQPSNEHVFYRELKGQEIDLARFQGALEALSDDDLAGMFDQIPREWNNDKITKMSSDLRSVRDHAAEFVNQVKWRLA